MNANNRSARWLLLALVVCLPACQAFGRLSTKPTPPHVSDCLEEPSGVYPDEPLAPKPGASITDAYVLAWKLWGNQVLGIATVDRMRWRGERRCIRKLQDAGLVR